MYDQLLVMKAESLESERENENFPDEVRILSGNIATWLSYFQTRRSSSVKLA